MEGLAAERRKAPVFLGVDTHSDALTSAWSWTGPEGAWAR